MPSGRAGSAGASTASSPSPYSSSGSGWPRLSSRSTPDSGRISPSTHVVNPSTASRPSRRAPSRSRARSSRCATASSVGSVSAASRNAPRTTATASTAPSPLPRTSPTASRTPYGVSCTAYRSPPMKASAWAASYQADTCSPPMRSAGFGSTARCAASAIPRAEASRSPLRRTTRLISSASPATVTMVASSVSPWAVPEVPWWRCSRNTVSTARMPVRAVAHRVYSGAAISGAAEKDGDPVKLGGVSRSKARPAAISTPGSTRSTRRAVPLPPPATRRPPPPPFRPSPTTRSPAARSRVHGCGPAAAPLKAGGRSGRTATRRWPYG